MNEILKSFTLDGEPQDRLAWFAEGCETVGKMLRSLIRAVQAREQQ